jgi:hypothetical protein
MPCSKRAGSEYRWRVARDAPTSEYHCESRPGLRCGPTTAMYTRRNTVPKATIRVYVGTITPDVNVTMQGARYVIALARDKPCTAVKSPNAQT